MKKILCLAISIMVLLVLICSCRNKTDANNNSENASVNHNINAIIGTWEGEEDGKTTSFTFNKDGTGLVINGEKKEIAINYTIVSDTQIDIQYDIDGEIIDNVSTYKLDGDTLTLDEVTFVRQ